MRLKCGRVSVAADGEVFTISPGGGERPRVFVCVCGFRALIGRVCVCVCVAEVTATAALLNTDVNMGGLVQETGARGGRQVAAAPKVW